MGQWTRDHVPFPGAAFRQTVEQLVRGNGLMDGTASPALSRDPLPGAQRDGRARPHRAAGRPPSRCRELVGAQDAASCGCGRPRRAGRRPRGGQGHAARHRGLDRRPQRGGVMDVRRPNPSDIDALLAFFARIPAASGRSSRRRCSTARPSRRGGRPGRRGARRATAATSWATSRSCRWAAGRTTWARCGWSSTPSAAARGSAARSPAGRSLQAIECGLQKLYVEVVAEQEGAVAMFTALGFQAEGLLRDHVRDRDGQLRDLVLLAHPIADQLVGDGGRGDRGRAELTG